MAGTAEVLKQLPQMPGTSFPCLTPNEKAAELYFSTGSDKYCDQVAILVACSESFNKANLNRSIAQTLEICAKTADVLKSKGVKFRAATSTVIGCPFDGPTDPQKVREICKELYDMGAYEVMLGDTIGVGVPDTVERLLNEVSKSVPMEKLALHSHDTYGSGVANVLTAVKVRESLLDWQYLWKAAHVRFRWASGPSIALSLVRVDVHMPLVLLGMWQQKTWYM